MFVETAIPYSLKTGFSETTEISNEESACHSFWSVMGCVFLLQVMIC
jgi:hypothetical protein